MRKREIARRIKEWLKDDKERKCPFGYHTCMDPRFCDNQFKRSKKYKKCPCEVYSLSYVTRRAKQIINELEGK